MSQCAYDNTQQPCVTFKDCCHNMPLIKKEVDKIMIPVALYIYMSCYVCLHNLPYKYSVSFTATFTPPILQLVPLDSTSQISCFTIYHDSCWLKIKIQHSIVCFSSIKTYFSVMVTCTNHVLKSLVLFLFYHSSCVGFNPSLTLT